MKTIRLIDIAHARSGDKGDTANIGLIARNEKDYDTANIGLIARNEKDYPILEKEVTAERVKAHFEGICKGEVERFEMANIGALNFLLHESLGGGGTVSLMHDAQGKTFAAALLRMSIEVPEDWSLAG